MGWVKDLTLGNEGKCKPKCLVPGPNYISLPGPPVVEKYNECWPASGDAPANLGDL